MTDTISIKLSLRSRLHHQINPALWHGSGLSPLNKVIVLCIFLAVIMAIAETEPAVRTLPWFSTLTTITDRIFSFVFTAELMLRFWVIGEAAKFRGMTGRVKYLFTPATLIDIAALIPFYITVGADGSFMLRLFRFLRILTLAKLGRYSKAFRLLINALNHRRHELFISVGFAGVVLLFSATCLFVLEGPQQPEAFGSIPRALWWSVATLTTVGYGDVYPVTVLGRLFGGITAFTGIAIIAMPTGIIAAALSDAFQERQK
ncbi:MAG: ion transporter [Magnetovibrio sp.]|nr:ion transporter [Magnetovibrio sp.]